MLFLEIDFKFKTLDLFSQVLVLNVKTVQDRQRTMTQLSKRIGLNFKKKNV